MSQIRKCCGTPKGQGPHKGGCPQGFQPAPRQPNASKLDDSDDVRPDYSHECQVCGASPIVPITGMCGPCTFGEADTLDGDW